MRQVLLSCLLTVTQTTDGGVFVVWQGEGIRVG